MEFNSKTHKVILSSIKTEPELKAFRFFLKGCELPRHQEEVEELKDDIIQCKETTDDKEFMEALAEFFNSAILRHQEDIDEINILLRGLK